MESKNEIMKKAFKHYKGVLIGTFIAVAIVFILIASILTKDLRKASILAVIVVGSNFVILGALLFPLRYFICNYNEVMEQMKTGDLNFLRQINEYESNTLLKKLTHSIGQVLEGFVEVVKVAFSMISSIVKVTDQIDQDSHEAIIAIEQMSKMMEQIAEGAVKQAAESQTGEALMESLAKEITTAYDNCNLIKEEADSMMKLNHLGNQSIHTLQKRAEGTNIATKEIGQSIQLLMNKMEDITSFVETIENISSQTNLLALNAAIEAARAGDAGRGFGVVADEIRKLADESHGSTNEIKNLVEHIAAETSSVQEAMEKMQIVSEEETEAVRAAEEVFAKIELSINHINEKVEKTYEAITKVNEDKDYVSKVIEEVAVVTQETAAHTEEGASFAEDQVRRMEQIKQEVVGLNQIVQVLDEKLSQYKMIG